MARIQKTNDTANKFGPFVALGLLACCIVLYFSMGLDRTYGSFPTKQVLWSLPIAFVMWALCAAVDSPAAGHEKAWAEDGQADYRTVSAFVTCMIFGSTAATGVFIMFGVFGIVK